MVIVEIPLQRICDFARLLPDNPEHDMYLFWELMTGKELEWENKNGSYTFWVVCSDELEAVEYKLKWL